MPLHDLEICSPESAPLDVHTKKYAHESRNVYWQITFLLFCVPHLLVGPLTLRSAFWQVPSENDSGIEVRAAHPGDGDGSVPAGSYLPSTHGEPDTVISTTIEEPCPSGSYASALSRVSLMPQKDGRIYPDPFALTTLSWAVDSIPELSTLSKSISNTIANNAVRFRGQSGEVYAFLPGHAYKEVYVRDMAYALSTAQYLYPDPFLKRFTEEVLARQIDRNVVLKDKTGLLSEGLLFGLIDPDGQAGKSTATSDEEPSLIYAAYQYFKLKGGADWLRCRLNGASVLDRLDSAMQSFYAARLNKIYGLIQRAHTTDWGDVKFQGGDKPTEATGASEYWTASLYDQALTYSSMLELAEMNRAVQQRVRAELWEHRAEDLKEQANRLLWQPDRGFYRTMLHITPLSHDFDEDSIVSVINAVAVDSGMAEPEHQGVILSRLEDARIRAGVAKPGLTLFPPYPESTFRHHLMYFPFRYQNGGQWDWWAGVQIKAEFSLGYSRVATQHLRAIAKDWSLHPNNIVEWQHPATGALAGSDHYLISAATVSNAIIEGLFGIDVNSEGFALSPRLVGANGYIQVHQLATGYSVWLRQRASDEAISLQYSVEHSGGGGISILLPWDKDVTEARFDSKPVPISTREVGEDRYVVFEKTPSGAHSVDVVLRPRSVDNYGAAWLSSSIEGRMDAGGQVQAIVQVKNTGKAQWTASGRNNFTIGYRWLDSAGQVIAEMARLELHSHIPGNVLPGDSVTAPVLINGPSKNGRYTLELDIVYEGVAWLKDLTNGKSVMKKAVVVG